VFGQPNFAVDLGLLDLNMQAFVDAGKDPAARQAQKAFRLRKAIEDRAQEKLRVLEDIFRLHAGERVIVFAGSNAMAFEASRRFLLPTIQSQYSPTLLKSVSAIMAGTHRSGWWSTSTPRKPRAATPITVSRSVSTVTVWPSTAGSPPNRRFQKS